jgi:hypothetical protein
LFDKWYGWKCRLTTNVDVTVPATTTGTVSVPTADAIDEVTENFSIALELLRLQPLSTITMPCGNDHSCFGYEGTDVVFNFTLATLLIDHYLYFCID